MTGKRHITVEIDGHGETQFHKMTPYDRMDVAETIRTKERSKLEADLKSAGATGVELFKELRAFDDGFDPYGSIYRHVSAPDGTVQTFERALKSYGAENAKERLNSFTPTEDEAIQLVAELWGVKLKTKEAAEASDLVPKDQGPEDDCYGDPEPTANPTQPETTPAT